VPLLKFFRQAQKSHNATFFGLFPYDLSIKLSDNHFGGNLGSNLGGND
jgi:hypothetical protein